MFLISPTPIFEPSLPRKATCPRIGSWVHEQSRMSFLASALLLTQKGGLLRIDIWNQWHRIEFRVQKSALFMADQFSTQGPRQYSVERTVCNKCLYNWVSTCKRTTLAWSPRTMYVG